MHGEVCLRERLTLRHVRHDVDFGRVRVVSTPLAALTLAAANPCMDSASPATSEALAAASASRNFARKPSMRRSTSSGETVADWTTSVSARTPKSSLVEQDTT